MLDCHIIVSADTPREWVAQCLDSASVAANRAGFHVAVRSVAGVVGHIGRARAAGYAAGSYPYVTCIDDDDYVLPDAFARMREALRLSAPAVCTPELTLQNGHLRSGPARHHLIAYRREDLIDHAAWTCCGDVAQIAAIPNGAVDITDVGYVHRIYMDSKARVMRRTRLEELENARG